MPLSIYWFKDAITRTISNQNFHDSLATSFAFIGLGIAFPFLPLPLFVILLALTFILTFIHPLLGLMDLLLLSLPMLIYQAPLLAWLAMILVSISLFLGYQHYRVIVYAYTLSILPLTYLGGMLEIPGLILSILVLGFRRSAILGTVAIILAMMVSAMANIPLSGPIVYDTASAHNAVQSLSYIVYFQPTKSAVDLGGLLSAWSNAWTNFFSFNVTSHITDGMISALSALGQGILWTLLQVLVWLFVAFSVSSYAVSSRSPYKGSIASIFGAMLPTSSYIIATLTNAAFNPIIILSFIITPIFLFILEIAGIDVVLALDVMKKDILGKFGVAFEDLTSGSTETLDDVANYSQTKKELKEAILGPIEHRELAGAYKISPTKGVLLFGPPGTGKTLIMRALANEIHAAFFYVKASSLLSPFSGESSQTLSKIFATAKKHSPCVLFFDEIDSLAGRRETQESSTNRELLTTLLSEMDGFQKISDVVVVGATNVPQLLDPAIMRPGRFDKILYMPLPDQPGRSSVFKHYLSGLPISKTQVDFDKLASLTQRFSPADIKNICEEVSREVGDKAVSKHEMLMIKMSDIVRVIKETKPSTSLSQLEQYNTFQIDYERRAHPETVKEDVKRLGINDVIGLDEAKKALREAIEIPILHPELIKKYDIGNIKGILLFGPPGTGKTTLLQAVANEFREVHVLTVSGYDIAKYGAERATDAVREIFDRAKENAPAIVFIDEIDALVPSRDSAKGSELQLTGEFLQEFDRIKQETGIVVVAATNRPDDLDPALLRPGRFDRLVFTPPPNSEDRAKIFQINLEKAPMDKDVDFEKLAEITEGFTGADISNICRQAKLNGLEASVASGKELEISMKDITALIKRARPSASTSTLGRYLSFFSRYGKR